MGELQKMGMYMLKVYYLLIQNMLNDPKTPVRASYIPEIISQQTEKTTAVINYTEVLAGKRKPDSKNSGTY